MKSDNVRFIQPVPAKRSNFVLHACRLTARDHGLEGCLQESGDQAAELAVAVAAVMGHKNSIAVVKRPNAWALHQRTVSRTRSFMDV